MKQTTRERIKTLSIIGSFILLFIAAYFLYRHFSDSLKPVEQLPQLKGEQLAPAQDAKSPEQAEDQAAPELNLVNNLGERVALSSLKGRIVFLNFWASNCGYCRLEFPEIQAFYDAHKDEKDFYFYSVHLTDSWESKDAGDKYIKGEGFSLPYFYDQDGQAQKNYQAYSLPITAVVSPDGKLYAYHRGAVKQADLDSVLEKIRAQQKP